MIQRRAYDGCDVFILHSSRNFRVQGIVLGAEENAEVCPVIHSASRGRDDTCLSNSQIQGKVRSVVYEEYR